VHSLDPNRDLKDGDLRLRLIRHAQNPYAMDNAINYLKQQAESEFEVQVSKRLRQAGFKVIPQWKVGAFRIDMVVEGAGKRLAVECDGEKYHGNDKLEEDMKRQAILERLGWTFTRIRGSKFFRNPDEAMVDVFKKLEAMEIPPEALQEEADYQNSEVENSELLNRVKARVEEIRKLWNESEVVSTTVCRAASAVSPAAVLLEIPKEDSQVFIGTKVNKRKDVIFNKTKINKSVKYKQREEQVIIPKEVSTLKISVGRHVLSNKDLKTKNYLKYPEAQQISMFEINDESNSVTNLDNLGMEGAISFLKKQGLKVVDKRVNGGCLWVIGGKELSSIIRTMAEKGMNLKFTDKGGRATGHKPAWYWKEV